ncbi:low-density lipoprotein receptor-related protein 4 isoform X1 [Fopius arisanus]|uniref:Low-density lipoprotein receptor-related protein 4 isoform X1 n=1 Tax=Fopius arisanus TaxID=64838 RepID=A0A0C9PMP0_9HYME|nr:PREDICTED: low-density lipoprotein receptor-related protein 4 isoform X1 [Fopius arisanus]
MQEILVIIFAIALGCIHGESTTHIPINRGAARQMYGSGSLRQTSSPNPIDSTAPTDHQNPNRNGLHSGEKPHAGYRDHPKDSVHGYGNSNTRHSKSHSKISSGFPVIPMTDEDYEANFEAPSNRNGATGVGMRIPNPNGGLYGQGPPGMSRVGLTRGRGRDGFYGSFDTSGYYREVPHRSRINHGGNRGHGISSMGEANSDSLSPDLVHNFEDDNDNLYISCKNNCANDQFLCLRPCECIDVHLLCDGMHDCDTGEDELDCEEIIEARKSNGTCYDEQRLLCPETGFCIAAEWLCDGDDDCGDFSDESNCGVKKNCTQDQFECRNGLCVPQSWRCDGDNDCSDFSDEENCTERKKCREDEFACTDGPCLPRKFMCDGDSDCDDGSDEFKCYGNREVDCGENYFVCATAKCVRKEYRCDGSDDCGDASDEENCPNLMDCNADQFKCETGDCISKLQVCDGQHDCNAGEDETNCEHPTPRECSTPEEFACATGNCISHSWVCDGVPDCSGGEDEDGCPLTCDATQYLCKSPPDPNETVNKTPHMPFQHTHAYCINKKRLCDGIPDCPLKEDEDNCPKKRNCTSKDKCKQQCILTASNENACACDSGFSLSGDNVTCLDINECEFSKEPVCSQLCNNTYGGFACGCITGYILRPDMRTCKANGGNPSLILTNRVDIRRVSLASATDNTYTPILKGLHNAIAVDYHYDKGLLYWSDVSLDMIKRVYVNGTNPEDVIRWGLESPGGVAIDWIHDLLFWTDSGTRRVEVITLESKIRHVLVSTDLDKPRGIAVHPHYGYVFWTDWGPSPKIERADMDGSDRQALITDGITWPNCLTIDYPTERIYWTDAKHPAIMSARLDGTDKKKVLSKGLHHPFGITIFEDLIYWTDWHFQSISSANKGNGKNFKTIRSNLYFPMDIHSYHKQRQPSYPNHCGNNNGRCSHMCLPNSTGYSCVCPVGFRIRYDGKNCVSNIDNFLIFARKPDLRLIPMETQSTRVFDTVIPVDHVQSAVALSWDPAEEMIYWTDVEMDTISRAHLNGSNQTVVINNNLESPAGLAMDWVTKKLYWTDAGTNRVECSNFDGTMRTLLVYKGLDKPRDIVVYPHTGHMYWSDWGIKPKIERAAMDGSKREDFIVDNIMWPNSLAIDFPDKRLYWADGGMKSIEYVSLIGEGKRTRVLSDLSHPFGLTLNMDTIYWTDWDTKSIHRANKHTGANATVVRAQLGNLMDVRAIRPKRYIGINPCKNNGGCSHLCLLTVDPPNYKCACPTGLIIEPGTNQKKCRSVPNEFLIFAHRVDIRMISFDVNYRVDVLLPVNYLKNASGVDVNRRTGEIYWTDPGHDVIAKSSFDGKNVTNIVYTSIDTADSLVVDSVGQKLYWTDAGLNSIEVCELDGRNRKVLIWSGLDNPRAIAVHYAKGLIFWTDWGHNARIERANMDGEERSTVIADNLVWPNGLSIDTQNDKLYWTDAKRKVIEVADLDGSNRRTLIKNIQHPYGLSVMKDSIYWSDWQTKAIHQANKISGSDPRVIVNKLEGIMDVRAISMNDIKGLQDACGDDNGGCSNLCLRNPRGYTCACPTGILLKDDKKTCYTSPKNFLLFAASKSLARISFDTAEKWEETLPISDIHHANSVDFHWNKSLIVYSDLNLRVIRTVNMHNFSDTKTIIAEPGNSEHSDSSPFKIAVDWLAGNIYWTNMKKRVIEVARIDGSSRKCLLTDLDTPWSIAVFPKLGYMFWTEWGKESTIQRALLDGTNKKAIITSNLYYPNGLSIDYEKRKLYWADSVKDRIEMSDLNGNYRIQLVPRAERPYGLSQYGEFIYWAGWDQTMVKRADKTTGNSWINIRTSLHGISDVKAVSEERQRGWSPCAVDNGGCTHLCFFIKSNYTCGCPDTPNPNCSTVPKQRVPVRKPGTENNPDYDEHNENEKPVEVFTRPTHRDASDKFKNYKINKDKGYATMTITIIVISGITVVIICAILYLVCQRKPKQEKYMYTNRRNVLTFSNPNYNASVADVGPSNPPAEKKSSIWKRLKYDSSQERVYEDNGQSPSPEVVSLIPPSATPSSSRAPSVTPRESSPSLIHVTHLNG